MCHETMRRASGDNKKAPAKGLRSHTLSLEECEPAAAWAGVLTYGFGGRLQWRDRGRFSRPSPKLPDLQDVGSEFMRRGVECQLEARGGVFASAVPAADVVPALGKHQIRGNLDAGSSIVPMVGAITS